MIKYGWIKTVKLTKDSFIKNKTIQEDEKTQEMGVDHEFEDDPDIRFSNDDKLFHDKVYQFMTILLCLCD